MKTSDFEFNKFRKQILERLDRRTDDLTSCELGFYGLTPYLNKISPTFDERIVDFYYRYDETKYPISHLVPKNENRYFMEIQYEALEFINNHKKTILLAPTSFGKTLIVKEYIYKKSPNCIVYIVPTNALSYELQKSFRENPAFNDYDLFDRSVRNESSSSNTKKTLFIGTQEKFLEAQFELGKVDFAVIDEAYKLTDAFEESRSFKLSKTFLEIFNNFECKICLLAPNLKLIGFEEYGFDIFETKFNAVDKVYKVISDNEFFETLNQKAKTEKTIFYCKTPNSISQCFEYIDQHDIIDINFVKQIEDDFHPDWTVAKMIRKGVLVHDGLMPRYLQNKMLYLFNKNDSLYKLLIGTNSISEGINTPARNIFIHPECNGTNNLMLLKNTIGRAGRLGVYPIGQIYSTTNFEEKANEDLCLEVSLSSQEGRESISDMQDLSKIDRFCVNHGISRELYELIMAKFHITPRRFALILNALKEKDYKVSSFSHIVWITYRIHKGFSKNEKYLFNEAKKDVFLIRALLQRSYLVEDENGKYDPNQRIYLNTYSDRIEFFKILSKRVELNYELTNSEIMDSLIKLAYSRIDHDYCQIALIAKEIEIKQPLFPFGENVAKITNNFLQRYYSFAYGLDSFLELDEGEKLIYQSLREFGINLKKVGINVEIVREINNNLKSRYSLYDIVNVVKELSQNSPYKNTYKDLLEKYLDYAL